MIDRRSFNLGVAGSLIAVAGAGQVIDPARAAVDAADRWQQYQAIVAEAGRLGLAAPRSGTVRNLGLERALPVFSDLLETLERSAAIEQDKSAAAENLIDAAAELVRATRADEAAPSEAKFPPETLRSLRSSFKRPVLDANLRAEYERLFASMTVRPEHRSMAAWYLSRLKEPANQARYQQVAARSCVPWFAIGILHGMEASFNFRGHLHNGDSLKSRTKQVPAGRPAVWNPPNSWEESAIDALEHDKLTNVTDWTLAATLFRWEGYNGFRSRVLHGINTPYLWSFSNHYARGKYVADNRWDANAVSRQCGAAVMLKMLVEERIVTIPA